MTKATIRALKGQAVLQACKHISSMPKVDSKTKKAMDRSKGNRDRLSKAITDRN